MFVIWIVVDKMRSATKASQPTVVEDARVMESIVVGIERLVACLRKELQPGRQDLKGDKLNVFFGSTRLYLRKGQRMAEFDQFYTHAVEQIEELGVTLDDGVG